MPRGPLIQECQPPGVCCTPLWVHEPLLWFQSITHSLHQHYKCQGMPTAMPEAPVGSSSRSCFCQACQCVGIDCHLANLAILLCQYVLSVPELYCYDAWALSDAARQWHTTVLSGFKSLLVMPMSVPTTCDYSFLFGCQQAAAWMYKCTMEWYCRIQNDWCLYSWGLFL